MRPYNQDEICTIYHGDALAILPALEPFSICITDPPYQQYSHGSGASKKSLLHQGQAFKQMSSFDPMPLLAMLKLLMSPYNLVVFSNTGLVPTYCHYVYQQGLKFEELILWKPNAMPFGGNGSLKKDVEHILHLYEPGIHVSKGLAQDAYSRVYVHHNGDTRPRPHPLAKPQPLLHKLVSVFTGPDDIVVDPFMGGGSTLLTCKALGRRCIGIELDKAHCATAANLLTQAMVVSA